MNNEKKQNPFVEYLLYYGWSLIVIMAVIATLVFLIGQEPSVTGDQNTESTVPNIDYNDSDLDGIITAKIISPFYNAFNDPGYHLILASGIRKPIVRDATTHCDSIKGEIKNCYTEITFKISPKLRALNGPNFSYLYISNDGKHFLKDFFVSMDENFNFNLTSYKGSLLPNA